jgi:hypothetical protein
MSRHLIIRNALNSIFLLLLFSSTVDAKTYTLVIEPSFPVEQGLQVYEPLKKWLSKKMGDDIKIIIDNNYYFYWRNAHGSRMPDFSFDAPHIAAFRADNKDYKVIATTIEPLSYHLISLDEPPAGQSVQDFMVSKNIIMLPNPSLGSVYFNKWFTDLFAAPNKDVTALSWQEAVEIIFDGSVQAAIVPNWIVNLYPNFTSIKHSEDMPGSTFMASPNVPKDVVEKFQEALLSLQYDDEAYDVLVELNTQGFKKANIDDYKPLLKLLPGNK